MNLLRTEFKANGIFSVLQSEDGAEIYMTLEHAYLQANGLYIPKIPNGTFECFRGIHVLEPTQLNPKPKPFETFEIMGVAGHSDLLFHVGNFNLDSEGCVLLGLAKTENNILNSRQAFNQFMNLKTGINQFTLTVQGDQ